MFPRDVAGTNARNLPSLEGLRLVSSVTIVASHYFKYLNLPTRGLQLAVDLFFVISGIVIAMGYQGRLSNAGAYLDFVRKRIARLYPLHFVTLLFYVLIGLLVINGKIEPESSAKYNFSELIPNLFMVHAWSPLGQISFNYVSWSISAEFFVYLCFPLIGYAMSVDYRRSFLVFVALLAVAIGLSKVVTGRPMPDLNWEFGALRAVPSFTFGVWLWIHRQRVSRLPMLRSHAPVMLALASIILIAALVVSPSDYLLLAGVYAVAVTAFACDTLGKWTVAAWRPLSDRGYLTYSIYMLHTVVATVVISFFGPKILGRSLPAIWATVVLSVAGTYWLAMLSYWRFEKPVREWLNSLPLRNSLSAESSTSATKSRN